MATREERLESVQKAARMDAVFLVLIVLSKIVVSIGRVKDNIAAVLAAMLIAPLGPNIALALRTAIGDSSFVARALKTNLAGVTIALTPATAIGFVWPVDLSSRELIPVPAVGLIQKRWLALLYASDSMREGAAGALLRRRPVVCTQNLHREHDLYHGRAVTCRREA